MHSSDITIELGLSNNAHSSETDEKTSKYVDFRKSEPTVSVFCAFTPNKFGLFHEFHCTL